MKKIKNTILIISVSFLFSACSWNEYFAVFNLSNEEITIEYQLNPTTNFQLFTEEPRILKCKNNNIDWEQNLPSKDLDSLKNNVKLILPANSVLIFGELNNDHYNSQNQEFINRRTFNFEQMNIKTKEKIKYIPRDKFDDNFTKVNGVIELRIK